METNVQLLASPDLLLDHPELHWERSAAAGAPPRLSVAGKLFDSSKKVDNFRFV